VAYFYGGPAGAIPKKDLVPRPFHCKFPGEKGSRRVSHQFEIGRGPSPPARTRHFQGRRRKARGQHVLLPKITTGTALTVRKS